MIYAKGFHEIDLKLVVNDLLLNRHDREIMKDFFDLPSHFCDYHLGSDFMKFPP